MRTLILTLVRLKNGAWVPLGPHGLRFDSPDPTELLGREPTHKALCAERTHNNVGVCVGDLDLVCGQVWCVSVSDGEETVCCGELLSVTTQCDWLCVFSTCCFAHAHIPFTPGDIEGRAL